MENLGAIRDQVIALNKKQTNYDRLRAKSVEEMAEFMKNSGAGCPGGCFVGDYGCKDCKDCWLDWLKQEVSE